MKSFYRRFFPHSLTLELKWKIAKFEQRRDKRFNSAWEQFSELLRECPHHGFSEHETTMYFYEGLDHINQISVDLLSNFIDEKTPNELKEIFARMAKNFMMKGGVRKTKDQEATARTTKE